MIVQEFKTEDVVRPTRTVTMDAATGFYYETRTAADAYYVRRGCPEKATTARLVTIEDLDL